MLDVIETLILFDEKIMLIEEQFLSDRESVHVSILENWC